MKGKHRKDNARFQATAEQQMRSTIFWLITQRVVVVVAYKMNAAFF